MEPPLARGSDATCAEGFLNCKKPGADKFRARFSLWKKSVK